MTRDTDLIRRGDAISWCDKWIATFGAVEIRHTSAREYALDAVKDLRDALHSIPAHPAQEPPSPGVTAGATGPVSDADFLRDAGMDGAKWAAGFKAIAERLGHHGMDEGWLIGWFCNAIMAGYDEAERRYRNATPAPVVPADQRAAIEALADRMWRVHPKDIHAAGYEHLERGGKYENPRAAWYADQIEALFKQFRDQVSPVVPAEGLERALLAHHEWHQRLGVIVFPPEDDQDEPTEIGMSAEYDDSRLHEQTVAALAGASIVQSVDDHAHAALSHALQYLRGEAPNVMSGGHRNGQLRSMIKWVLLGCGGPLRSAPPVGARVTDWQPIETAPKDGVTEVLMYDPGLGMAVWPSTNSPWPDVTHWMPLPEPPAALLPAGEGE